MEFTDSINIKFARLKSLRTEGDLSNREIQTEIADIVAHLKLNGFSDEMIEGRSSHGQPAVPAIPEPSLEERIEAILEEKIEAMLAARQEKRSWRDRLLNN